MRNGVSWYSTGIAHIPVHFPEGHVCCRYCPFCKANRDFGTFFCVLTDQYIFKDELDVLGRGCPVTFEEVWHEQSGTV